MLEVCRIIFVQIRRGLEEETYQKVAIDLLNIQELEVGVLCLASKFGVSKSIQERDEEFFEIRTLLFWVNTFVLLQ